MAPTHSGFSSAYNLINAGAGTGYSITGGASGNYSNAYNKEVNFLSQFTTTCKNVVKISFEKDNGWLDVDGTASSINQLLAAPAPATSQAAPITPQQPEEPHSFPEQPQAPTTPTATRAGRFSTWTRPSADRA